MALPLHGRAARTTATVVPVPYLPLPFCRSVGNTSPAIARRSSMAGYDFDLFTIGAGSGGVAGSRRAGSYGAKVGIAESVRIGGTCVLRGCVPKKLLVYGAEFVDAFEDSAGFGWTPGELRFDWARLIAAKDKELDRLHGIYVNLLKSANVEIFHGHAKLGDPHTVEIAGKHLTAAHIMIATGARPEMPQIPR